MAESISTVRRSNQSRLLVILHHLKEEKHSPQMQQWDSVEARGPKLCCSETSKLRWVADIFYFSDLSLKTSRTTVELSELSNIFANKFFFFSVFTQFIQKRYFCLFFTCVSLFQKANNQTFIDSEISFQIWKWSVLTRHISYIKVIMSDHQDPLVLTIQDFF